MELKADIYNAARDGKLQRMQTSLEACPKEQVKLVVQAKTDGATPLIMACRNGHLGIVEYLVDKCQADVEQVGSVRFDGETIDGAPPLWCAAAAGHMNIVRLLVRYSAGVNKTTSTNSTPLRAACFDGHLDIVQYLVDNDADLEIANRHGHTCLMISCYKGHYAIVKYLIEKRANVNRKSIKGNTALHDCAESGSLDIMKLLLASAAVMEKDSYGMTPLLAAAVTGHTRIVEYLIARCETTRLQRIEALELLGATYVDKKRDMLGALKFWKLSMADRYCIDRVRLNKPLNASPIPAYENAVEVQTVDELNELISDPDSMRMQALLIRERILGPAHPDTSYYIRYRGAVYADMGNFERCIILWMYALDMQQKILEPLSPMTQSSFLSFAELFSFMMTDSRHWRARVIAFKDMMVVFQKSVYELGVGMTSMAKVPMTERDMTHFNRLLVIIMHLISLMCVVLPKATDDERLQFQKIAYQLVKMNPRGAKGYTPLHLACAKETSTVGRYPVCGFPSMNVAALLIKVGASVNAVDVEHNAPLHIAAFAKPCKSDLIELLLNNGAHLDACNSDHVSPMQMLAEGTTEGATDSTCCCKCVAPLKYLTLQCLAARTIVKHDIKYEGCVPTKLESFVCMH